MGEGQSQSNDIDRRHLSTKIHEAKLHMSCHASLKLVTELCNGAMQQVVVVHARSWTHGGQEPVSGHEFRRRKREANHFKGMILRCE